MIFWQEQPLLLEELLEQEKQEQRRQQEQAMLQQKQEAGMLTGMLKYRFEERAHRPDERLMSYVISKWNESFPSCPVKRNTVKQISVISNWILV